jgi:hypothetical protein
MMKSYVPKKPADDDTKISETEAVVSKEKLPMSEICTSSKLDDFLGGPDVTLNVSYPIPRCEGADYVSEVDANSDLPPDIQVLIFISNTSPVQSSSNFECCHLAAVTSPQSNWC